MKKQNEPQKSINQKLSMVEKAEERERILQEGLTVIEAEERLEMVHFYSYLWTDPRILGK